MSDKCQYFHHACGESVVRNVTRTCAGNPRAWQILQENDTCFKLTIFSGVECSGLYVVNFNVDEEIVVLLEVLCMHD